MSFNGHMLLILKILGVPVICLILTVIYRTLRFKPIQTMLVKTEPIPINKDQILSDFCKMISIKTVSHYETTKLDIKQFHEFQMALLKMFPSVSAVCSRELIGQTGVLYRWQGQKKGSETVLMAHYDVVPADEKYWEVPPFSGEIKDGYVWGRGTLDTKITVLGIMSSVEMLIKEGFQPQNDVYLSFSGDEETTGASAAEIVKILQSRNIAPALVLDEGGVVLDQVFPGVVRPVALVGVAEKGYLDVTLTATSNGGHASSPPRHTLMGKMAKAIKAIETKPMKAVLTPPVVHMFDVIARHSTLLYRIIFSNLWLFAPLMKTVFKLQGGQMNALFRTTTAVTIVEGSKTFNVLPPEGKIGVNCRILSTDSIESTLAHIKKITKNQFTYEIVETRVPSPVTSIDTNHFRLIKETIHSVWSDVIVSPFLMIAATDARHFNEISENVIRFAPIAITQEELSLMHSNNERIKVSSVYETVQFYLQFIKKL